MVGIRDWTNDIHCGDAVQTLAQMPESSVHMCMTSPPYYGLRDYGVDGQIGLEETLSEYISSLLDVAEELRRVLRDDGSWWLNLGDTFAGSLGAQGFDGDCKDQLNASPSKHPARNAEVQRKSKLFVPHRVAIALQEAGWVTRQDVVWHKPNGLPNPVKDRPVSDKEFLFLLTPQPDYWWDLDAIREPHADASLERAEREYAGSKTWMTDHLPDRNEKVETHNFDKPLHPNGKNPGDVWEIPVKPFPDAHFACVSDDTEILTKEGWKTHDELQRGEKVATYDTDADRVELEPLSSVHTYDVDTELLHVGNRDLDILITEDHRNVTRNRETGEVRIRRGHELVGRDEILVHAPTTWETNHGVGEPLAELVGWVIAEGYYRDSGGIELYQNEGDDADRIDTLLADLRIPHTRSTRRENEVTWGIPKGVWTRAIRELASEKRLTEYLVSIPESDAQALFDGIIGGDGHIRDDGRISNTEKDPVERDWFQILAFRLGYHSINGTKDVHLTKRRSIGIRGTGADGLNVEPAPYEGVVWCPKTPNGTWVARRNGRPFITGNTFPPELCHKPIKSSCPPCVCADCGMPYDRDTEETNRVVAGGSPAIELDETGYKDRTGNNQGRREGFTLPERDVGEWEQQCDCDTDETEPGIVLDPFAGAGTACLVAKELGRRFVGIDLSPEYVAMAQKRVGVDVEDPDLLHDGDAQMPISEWQS